MSAGKPTENHMSRSSAARRALIDWVTAGLNQKGKTGVGLAKALGVNASGVSRIKGGARDLNAHEIPVVAAYLELPAPPEVTAAAEPIPPREQPAQPAQADSAKKDSPRNQALDDRRLKRLAVIAIRLALAGTHQRVQKREISSWAESAVQLFQDLQDDPDSSYQEDL